MSTDADVWQPAWLKLITDRLDHQDRALAEILRQAKRTNGRVTDLEQRAAVEDALRSQHDTQEQQAEKTATRRRLRGEFVLGSVCLLVAGAVDPLGHQIGLW